MFIYQRVYISSIDVLHQNHPITGEAAPTKHGTCATGPRHLCPTRPRVGLEPKRNHSERREKFDFHHISVIFPYNYIYISLSIKFHIFHIFPSVSIICPSSLPLGAPFFPQGHRTNVISSERSSAAKGIDMKNRFFGTMMVIMAVFVIFSNVMNIYDTYIYIYIYTWSGKHQKT